MAYLQTKKPIQIDRSIKTTCLSLMTCDGIKDVNVDDVFIRIKRAGTCEHLVEYPAEIVDERMCFVWDELLYELDCGRYIGDLFLGDKHIDFIQISLCETSCLKAVFEQVIDDEDLPECEPPDCDCEEE